MSRGIAVPMIGQRRPLRDCMIVRISFTSSSVSAAAVAVIKTSLCRRYSRSSESATAPPPIELARAQLAAGSGFATTMSGEVSSCERTDDRLTHLACADHDHTLVGELLTKSLLGDGDHDMGELPFAMPVSVRGALFPPRRRGGTTRTAQGPAVTAGLPRGDLARSVAEYGRAIPGCDLNGKEIAAFGCTSRPAPLRAIAARRR